MLIYRHLANIKSTNKNIKEKKKTPIVKFLTNKVHGICHFLSKNSAILHGNFQCVLPAFARRQYGCATQQ